MDESAIWNSLRGLNSIEAYQLWLEHVYADPVSHTGLEKAQIFEKLNYEKTKFYDTRADILIELDISSISDDYINVLAKMVGDKPRILQNPPRLADWPPPPVEANETTTTIPPAEPEHTEEELAEDGETTEGQATDEEDSGEQDDEEIDDIVDGEFEEGRSIKEWILENRRNLITVAGVLLLMAAAFVVGQLIPNGDETQSIVTNTPRPTTDINATHTVQVLSFMLTETARAPTPDETATSEQIIAEFIASETAAALTNTIPPTLSSTLTATPDISATETQRAVDFSVSQTEIALSYTPTPSRTPLPTVTPTPTPLFEDNFDAGLSDSWIPMSGSPLVANDKLTASENAWVLVGDSSWTDYSVEFDGNAASCRGDSFLPVRVQDLDNMIVFSFAHCETFWYIVENGEWNLVPTASTGNVGNGWSSIRITVVGDKFTFYDDVSQV